MAAVFISYSRKDSGIADEIASVLGQLGISCFYDRNNLRGGVDFQVELEAALRECVAVLVVISPASLCSQWVSYEVGHASGRGKYILPFVTEPNLELPVYLSRLQQVKSPEEVRTFFEPLRKFMHDVITTSRTLRRTVLQISGRPPEVLAGEWSGTGHQIRGPENRPITWGVKLRLTPADQQLNGAMSMHGTTRREPFTIDFDVKGGMVGGRFVWLNYTAQDPARLHFGTVVFDLVRDELGEDLIGEYTGYGAVTNGIVSGYITLRKTPPATGEAGPGSDGRQEGR